MNEFASFVFSPQGAVLFVLFWMIKAAAGLWIAGKAILLLPERLQHRPQRWLNAVTPKLARQDRTKTDRKSMGHDT